MLQSMGSQRVRHDLATEQQQPNPKQISIADTHKKMKKEAKYNIIESHQNTRKKDKNKGKRTSLVA